MIEFIEPKNFMTFYTTNQMSTDFTIRREPPGNCTQFGNNPSSLELLARATNVSLRLSLFLFYDHPKRTVDISFKWREDDGTAQDGKFSIGFKDQHKLEYSIAGKKVQYLINTDI